MLNTPGNRYYANPAAESARINPSSGAATVLRTVDPVHGPVLTGATGLPISALQIAPLADSPPPGVVVVSKAGDLAAGNPKYAMNLTNIYTFSSSWLRGVRLGGTVSKVWRMTSFRYYEGGVTIGKPRLTFYMPRPVRFDGIVGYERKWGRRTFSTQLRGRAPAECDRRVWRGPRRGHHRHVRRRAARVRLVGDDRLLSWRPASALRRIFAPCP
jgi:hypothetical protein